MSVDAAAIVGTPPPHFSVEAAVLLEPMATRAADLHGSAYKATVAAPTATRATDLHGKFLRGKYQT